jgi:recombination protein RecA
MTNVDKKLRDKFGDEIFVTGQSIIDKPRMTIPTTPTVDLVLGGGIKEGSLVLITGPKKVGKTTMCLDMAATAQGPKFTTPDCSNGRHVYFFNVEARLEKRDLKGIPHLITSDDRLTIIQSYKQKILTAEEFIEIAETLIKTKPGSVFIIDSLSQLCTAGEMAADIADRYRADAPLLLAKFTRRIQAALKVNNCILFGVTHQIANQGQGMSKWTEASGQKVQYASDIKIRATYQTPYTANTDTQVGQEIHLECTWSNSGPPGAKSTTLLRYNYGLDKAFDLVTLGTELGIIQKRTSWFRYGEENIGQGKEKASDFIRNNPDIFESINTQIKEMMGLPNVGT